jgi:hypothetical protein
VDMLGLDVVQSDIDVLVRRRRLKWYPNWKVLEFVENVVMTPVFVSSTLHIPESELTVCTTAERSADVTKSCHFDPRDRTGTW